MTTVKKLHPKYITNTSGRQTAVILPIREYKKLLDDLDDLAVVAERVNEPVLPHNRVVRELKQDGYL